MQPEGFLLESCEPMTTWVIHMQGPDTSTSGTRMYEGRLFRLRFMFPERYPLEPPEVIWLPEVPVHPHIYSNGHTCLDVSPRACSLDPPPLHLNPPTP